MFDLTEDDAPRVNFRLLDEDKTTHDDVVGFGEVDFREFRNKKGSVTVSMLDKDQGEQGKISIDIVMRVEGEEPPAEESPPPAEEAPPPAEVVERAAAGPKMQVVVYVHNGQVNKKQDVDGLGDPYVELKVGDVQRNTSVQKNTLDPVWEQGIGV